LPGGGGAGGDNTYAVFCDIGGRAKSISGGTPASNGIIGCQYEGGNALQPIVNQFRLAPAFTGFWTKQYLAGSPSPQTNRTLFCRSTLSGSCLFRPNFLGKELLTICRRWIRYLYQRCPLGKER